MSSSKIQNLRFLGDAMILLAVVSFCAACKKSPSPQMPVLAPPDASAKQAPPEDPIEARHIAAIKSAKNLTESQKAFLLSYVPENIARHRQEIKGRQELVIPPPSGWRPEDARHKIKLTLIPEKTTIHTGQYFRYRLEVQNMGRDNVQFSERAPGFIKDGVLPYRHWFEFYVTPPGGKEKLLASPYLPSIENATAPPKIREYFPAGNTPAEKDAAFKQIQIEEQAEANLSLSLRPGETLVTRPAAPNAFRNLEVEFSFEKTGIYRVKAAYDDRPLDQPTEAHIQAMIREGYSREHQMKRAAERANNSLGFTESNEVRIEVVP